MGCEKVGGAKWSGWGLIGCGLGGGKWGGVLLGWGDGAGKGWAQCEWAVSEWGGAKWGQWGLMEWDSWGWD